MAKNTQIDTSIKKKPIRVCYYDYDFKVCINSLQINLSTNSIIQKEKKNWNNLKIKERVVIKKTKSNQLKTIIK